jgi:hypothetical protein
LQQVNAIKELAEQGNEIESLRSELRIALRAASRKESNIAELVQAVYRAAHTAHLAQGSLPPIVRPAKTSKARHRAEVALVHLTDWQLGKASISYGVATCEARIRQAMDSVVKIVQIQRADHPVDECHIMLGGDMVEGLGIFPGQAYEVEAHLFEQLVHCANLIETAVAFALENFSTVVVWEEIGNHGRLGRKGEMPHGDNIDRVSYTLARASIERRLTSKAQLIWHPYAGDLGTAVTVGNYKALLVHGDEIKSFGGNTPAFGILRKVTAWSSGVLEPFQDCYMGHWHTPMSLTMPNGNRIFVTGSPESDNGYAKEFVAATGKPSQRLHFIDPDKGRVTSEHVLWLD